MLPARSMNRGLSRLLLVIAASLISLPDLLASSPPTLICVSTATLQQDLSAGLIGHWPLSEDGRDLAGKHRAAAPVAVQFGVPGPGGGRSKAARFNGRNSLLTVPADRLPKLAQQDFSLSVWVKPDDSGTDVPGDLVSQFSTRERRGWQLNLKTSPVTFNIANDRQLQFGIDQNRSTDWTDCGRPGQALLAFGLTVHQGQLFAGTCEPGAGQSGRVYQYAGDHKWTDLGAPDQSNSVTAMASFAGQLYAATGKYRVAGSALEESPNTNLGGRIFRWKGKDQWELVGHLPGVEAVGGLVAYQQKLYATSLYKPAGFYRYERPGEWTPLPTWDGKRVEALTVHNGHLYATSYDQGHVFRFDGQSWIDAGQVGPEENTQTYSFATYEGRMYCGTWRTGRVFLFEDLNRWADRGRLGEELEVMGMLVHNGRFIAGSLPLAEVYEYAGDDRWTRLKQLDSTPDVKYRRVWSMAEYQGQLFASTLPSGKVFRWQAGSLATWDQSFPGGWQHVAAIRRGQQLELYVGGKLVSRSTEFDPAKFDLSVNEPLRIGLGPNDYFFGDLSDLRLYDRALTPAELQQLGQ